MIIDDKYAKKVDRYVEKLVDAAPGWFRIYIDKKKIMFGLDGDGNLEIFYDDSLSDQTKEDIERCLYAFFQRHPAKFITTDILQ